MPSASPPPTPYQHHLLGSPHRTLDLGSSYSSSQNGHTNTEGFNHRGHGLIHQRSRDFYDDEDTSSYELVKTYESGDSVLPTYSPSSSMTKLPRRLSSVTRSVSMPSGLADLYKQQGQEQNQQENNNALGAYGMSEKRVSPGARYAKLIPEQKPPRLPVS
jgi:hypothetical protein